MAVIETKAETQGLENTAETRRQGLIATGGVLGAVAASSCCIVPLALFSLGMSGVWIGNLAALSADYRSDHRRLPRIWLLPGLLEAEEGLHG
jgi:hypothetical protein